MSKPLPISAQTSEAITRILGDVGMQLVAVHEMTSSDMDEDEMAWCVVNLRAILKSSVRSIDACIERMGGCCLGNFRDQFEIEPEEVENHG